MSDETQPGQESNDQAPVPAVEPAEAPQAPGQWPAAPPSYPGAAAPTYPAAYPPYQTSPYPPAPKTSSNAIVALVLAVAAWVVCPIVPAIVSLVFASMASKEITASGDQLQGRGMVTAAKIVSWINIGFYAALIVIGAFVLVILAIAGGIDNN